MVGVEGVVVAGLQAHALGAECVVAWREQFYHFRIFDDSKNLSQSAGSLATSHSPRLHKGTVVHDSFSVEAGRMRCGKGLGVIYSFLVCVWVEVVDA